MKPCVGKASVSLWGHLQRRKLIGNTVASEEGGKAATAASCQYDVGGTANIEARHEVFYHGIEPRHLVLKDCEFFSKPPQSFDDFFYETYINVPRDPEPLPKGVLPYHLAMQKVCVCACARARV